MNNMYDILGKMNLLESKKPDANKNGIPDYAEDGKGKMEEAGYSAKAARAGQDIGKPGKAFATIAAKAGKAYGSAERGEKVAGAVLKKLRAKEDVAQEGNKFTGNLVKARAAGLKKADLDGDGDMETVREQQVDELDMKLLKGLQGAMSKNQKDPESERNIHKKYGYRSDRDETGDDDYDEHGNLKAKKKGKVAADGPKKKGRPAGSGRKLGAKGPTGRSKLMRMKEDESQLVDKGEYDREGDMAKEQLHTIEAAAKELHSILSDDQNLPEWVQSKITKAMDYIDTARDYMASQEHDQEQIMPERKLSSSEKEEREDIVKGMKKNKAGFKKRYGDRGEEVMYATATKLAKERGPGNPDRKKKEKSVDETTVAGSVAPAPAAGKGKKGMVFGKGVYESQIAESFEKKLSILSEGMSINMSMGEDGQKSLTVSATDEDAVQLAQILKMAGLGSGGAHEETCSACGQSDCGCEQMEEDYSNSPEPETQSTEYMTKTIAGGLNKNKVTGMTTIPVVPTQQVSESEVESHLMKLYQQYKTV